MAKTRSGSDLIGVTASAASRFLEALHSFPAFCMPRSRGRISTAWFEIRQQCRQEATWERGSMICSERLLIVSMEQASQLLRSETWKRSNVNLSILDVQKPLN